MRASWRPRACSLATSCSHRTPWSFSHSIVREAIYGGWIPRNDLHCTPSAAQMLANAGAEPEVIAEHVLLSSKTDESMGSGGAARRRTRGGAKRRSCCRTAISAPCCRCDGSRSSLAVAVDRGWAGRGGIWRGGVPTAFRASVDDGDRPREQADALFSLGAALYRFGRYGEAQTTFRRGAELFVNSDERLRFESAAWSTHCTSVANCRSASRRDRPRAPNGHPRNLGGASAARFTVTAAGARRSRAGNAGLRRWGAVGGARVSVRGGSCGDTGIDAVQPVGRGE